MIFPQWQTHLVSLIVSYIYIYIYIPRKKKLTKKLGSFYTDSFNFVSLVPTRSIIIIKYDVVVIICDDNAI